MENKRKYYKIKYTKIKQVYAQSSNKLQHFKTKENTTQKEPMFAHNSKVSLK